MKFILDLARPEIVAMTPYSSARSEQKGGKIFLNANENPWDRENLYNRYPEPQPEELITKLSNLYQVNPEQLLVARGSDEVIDLLLRVFCVAGQDAIMITPPTYGMYKVSAAIQNAAVISVPLIKEQNFALDVDGILKNYRTNIKLIFLCSPNNPTGNLLGKDQILYLCQQLQKKTLIVVDEAYIEFSGAESMLKEISQYPNLVVLRTLSKAHGLAGVRCGSVIAHPMVIKLLQQIIAPYPIPRPVVSIICENLSENKLQQMKRIVAELIEQREILTQFLEYLPFVKKIWTSRANYILFRVTDAKKIMNYCLTQGVIIRDRSNDFSLDNCLRISVGTPAENQILMRVLKNAAA